LGWLIKKKKKNELGKTDSLFVLEKLLFVESENRINLEGDRL